VKRLGLGVVFGSFAYLKFDLQVVHAAPFKILPSATINACSMTQLLLPLRRISPAVLVRDAHHSSHGDRRTENANASPGHLFRPQIRDTQGSLIDDLEGLDST
jgi:hypothetical protein